MKWHFLLQNEKKTKTRNFNLLRRTARASMYLCITRSARVNPCCERKCASAHAQHLTEIMTLTWHVTVAVRVLIVVSTSLSGVKCALCSYEPPQLPSQLPQCLAYNYVQVCVWCHVGVANTLTIHASTSSRHTPACTGSVLLALALASVSVSVSTSSSSCFALTRFVVWCGLGKVVRGQ